MTECHTFRTPIAVCCTLLIVQVVLHLEGVILSFFTGITCLVRIDLVITRLVAWKVRGAAEVLHLCEGRPPHPPV